jgi:hypothetical protein
MKAIRLMQPLAACMALLLVASAAHTASYTFAGKLTTNRGRNANVPMAGNTGCGSLSIVTGPVGTAKMTMSMVPRGVNTQPPGAVGVGFMWKTAPGVLDQGCVKAALPLNTTGKGTGVGKGFSLPAKAFQQDFPRNLFPAHYKLKTDIPVVAIKNFAPAVQLATSVSITAPPKVRAHYEGTQGTMGMFGGPNKHAAFRKFRAGAWSTQTGRGAGTPKFSWCPPPIPGKTVGGMSLPWGAGGACTNISQAGFPAIIKYPSTNVNSFGGTMSMVTHQISGVGSIALFLGGPFAFNNFGGGESLGTGRGYADYNHITIPSGDIHKSGTIGKRYIGPRLMSQTVIGMVAPTKAGMWPAGNVFDWGFPWTTMTVVVRNHNAANTRATTFTAKGWDCPGTMAGPGCGLAGTKGLPKTGVVNRNISLVSGSIGIARLPPPFGDSPISNMGNMQLMVMPEPGTTLQLLAGVIGLLGVAVWRSRCDR